MEAGSGSSKESKQATREYRLKELRRAIARYAFGMVFGALFTLFLFGRYLFTTTQLSLDMVIMVAPVLWTAVYAAVLVHQILQYLEELRRS
jgi:hypothetical protein